MLLPGGSTAQEESNNEREGGGVRKSTKKVISLARKVQRARAGSKSKGVGERQNCLWSTSQSLPLRSRMLMICERHERVQDILADGFQEENKTRREERGGGEEGEGG